MQVKFACMMSLEHNKECITEQVSSESNIFKFNQEISLKEISNPTETDILVFLVTNKGGKYVTGIIKLNIKQL